MTSEVWVSSVMTDSSIGLNQGAREKYYGNDWAPPSHVFDFSSKRISEAARHQKRGLRLVREELPEAMYVFDQKCWAKVRDLFYAGIFLAVKGKLAEVLMHFDLGEGELIEFPIYEADKKIQIPGPFYLLNFGCQKDTFLPEESRRVKPFFTMELDGKEVWRDNGLKDNDIAVTPSALEGPDLWFEPKLRERIFMSGRLHDAILQAKIKIDFRFAKARIIDV